MCELKSKTDRGSSSMSEIVAKRVGLFSSGEKRFPTKFAGPTSQHQPPAFGPRRPRIAADFPSSLTLDGSACLINQHAANWLQFNSWIWIHEKLVHHRDFFLQLASIDFPYATETNSSLHHHHVIMNTQKVRQKYSRGWQKNERSRRSSKQA